MPYLFAYRLSCRLVAAAESLRARLWCACINRNLEP